MAYTGNPSTVTTDAIRLLVGDISASTAAEYLADADYTFFYAQSSNDIYLAGSLAANSLAMLAAAGGVIEKQVGDLALKWDYNQYLALSRKLEQQAAANVSPYAGGISRSDKRGIEQDTDRVRPAIRRGQFDNPWVVDPNVSEPGLNRLSGST